MEISSPAFMEAPIPHPSSQTSMASSQYNSTAFTDACAPLHPEAFTQNSAVISRPRFAAGFIEKSAMETLMPNTIKPLSHHTSMEPLDDFRSHQGFIQTAMALDTGDFSANTANPWAGKKKTCRNGPPISRIENASSRQITFCKRRNGLFKKAYELSVLCDAEVGAIIFSPSGRLSEFASSSMNHILQRYQSFQPQMSSNELLLQDVQRWKREAILLKNKLKCLQDFQRCVFEKNNISFSIHEVQSVESMLKHALDKIRKRKDEILLNENNVLKAKLIQLMSMKEYVSNASSGCNDLCFQQDAVNTKLQLGLDILHHSLEEQNSYSSKN